MIAATLLPCAMNVSPVTLEAVVRVESGGNPLAVNVNRLLGPQPHPATLDQAVAVAESFIARGYSVDLGLTQVNSRNLPALGLSVRQVLDPCTNIRAGGTILAADYAEASRRMGEGQHALMAALSAFNTGTFWRGFANGYVARYYGAAGVPALAGGVTAAAAIKRNPLDPFTADTEVYSREISDVRVN